VGDVALHPVEVDTKAGGIQRVFTGTKGILGHRLLRKQVAGQGRLSLRPAGCEKAKETIMAEFD
jgi:hypothetical protein